MSSSVSLALNPAPASAARNGAGLALEPQLDDAAARALQPVDAPLRGHGPLVEHDDVVAGVLDVGQQVRREDHVDPLVAGDVGNQRQHLLAALGVHAVGGLVEEQQIGVVHERLGQLDPLFHAGGIGFQVAVAGLAEPDVEEHLVRPLHRVGPGQPGQLAAEGHERHRVHARNVPVGLGHVANPRSNRQRRLRHVQAEDGELPLGRRHEAEECADHRALARAVGTEQPDGAGREHRADVSKGRPGPIADRHALQFDHRWHQTPLRSPSHDRSGVAARGRPPGVGGQGQPAGQSPRSPCRSDRRPADPPPGPRPRRPRRTPPRASRPPAGTRSPRARSDTARGRRRRG